MAERPKWREDRQEKRNEEMNEQMWSEEMVVNSSECKGQIIYPYQFNI